MNNDLISRSALKKSIKSYADDQYAENEYLGEYAIMDIIDNAPAVDMNTELSVAYLKGRRQGQSEERPQGEWIDVNGDGSLWKCNNCGENSCCKGNFCPDCGAKMKGGKEE